MLNILINRTDLDEVAHNEPSHLEFSLLSVFIWYGLPYLFGYKMGVFPSLD